MRFEFDHIEISGVDFLIDGYAEFDGNPRTASAFAPSITLIGTVPAPPGQCGQPKELDLFANNALLLALNSAVTVFLKKRHFQAICQQWDDEAWDRRDAARGDAEAFRLDSYRGG